MARARTLLVTKETAEITLTAERLRELLLYDKNTGVFTWQVRPAYCINIGDVAGGEVTSGHLMIRVDGTRYSAHRLAWLYVNGVWPEDQIDHINGVRSDNRISNLREATRYENSQNRGTTNGRGPFSLGTSYRKDLQKWSASIRVDGRLKSLGHFETQEEAHKAYAAAKLEYHTFSPISYGQQAIDT